MNSKWIKGGLCAALACSLLAGCSEGTQEEAVDLNSMSFDEISELAKEDGEVNSVGMPDTWANWGETWTEIEETYGITHTDTDMSSAEELALFANEANDATKDIGDVGQSFGPVAEEQGVTLPYKTSYWDSIPDWAKDDDGDWIIGYYGTITFITNTNLVDEAPTSWQDILEGDYTLTIGDVSVATQAQSGLLSAAIAFGGDESNIQPGLDFFKTLAEEGRLDMGDTSVARLEKGEIEVAVLWDYNSLGYRSQILENNPDASFEVSVPTDGAIQSGYCTIINAYTKRPYAAAVAREYILSDEGQINLAKGYARPIRDDVELPEEVQANLLPDEQYTNARFIEDQEAWDEAVADLASSWQEQVVAYAQ
ncbi:putative spermidine/putrescine transport system substrate-binding protein [Faecalicoccus acidiformans]|uniref:Putative spermidine/putrescine transport system substrate-binding protein n=1 Tax=Faecalicoccus acidiformans TaxID=915173 RepID=A0A7W8D4X8_9FIRM|nr:ABC transporter substrate-binding protein [Faecalicoccus acidiformans]MBB5185600.1 putative spermidine/putrescine transport system substrate-binding protein [Faecalicoccus acidiformans]